MVAGLVFIIDKTRDRKAKRWANDGFEEYAEGEGRTPQGIDSSEEKQEVENLRLRKRT